MSLRRAGPTPYLRLDFGVKVREGVAAVDLVLGQGRSFREAAAALDLSVTTCWRRFWFVMDMGTPERHGCKRGPIPPQRGTRACPRGRPWMPTYDGRTTTEKGITR